MPVNLKKMMLKESRSGTRCGTFVPDGTTRIHGGGVYGRKIDGHSVTISKQLTMRGSEWLLAVVEGP